MLFTHTILAHSRHCLNNKTQQQVDLYLKSSSLGTRNSMESFIMGHCFNHQQSPEDQQHGNQALNTIPQCVLKMGWGKGVPKCGWACNLDGMPPHVKAIYLWTPQRQPVHLCYMGRDGTHLPETLLFVLVHSLHKLTKVQLCAIPPIKKLTQNATALHPNGTATHWKLIILGGFTM